MIFPPEELGVYGSVSPRWTKSSIHSRSSPQGEWIVPVKFHDRKKHRVCRGHVREEENAYLGKQAACNRGDKDEDMQHVACRAMA
ncbi:UNVERIFIED_CONTAM: hypothetical protein Sangu_1001400 [Sesamum angustifolium]|uniref:Uncharacterized protein n=1 Tax=Sesamum angustifolium TaxID=2727405 RepID=A0AAW2PHV0_9LAMI